MGTLFRALLILAVIWVAWRLLRKLFHHDTRRPARQRHIPSMHACVYCGTYVPETELVRVGQKTYCSRAHSEADKRA